MKTSALLFVSAGLWVATTAFAGDGKIHRSAKSIPGKYIVVLQPGADVDDVANDITERGKGRVKSRYDRAIRGAAIEMTEAEAKELSRDPRVAYVEEDSVIEATAISWGLDRIDQHYLPLNRAYHPPKNGKNVRAYIFDTGISPHDEFGGRLVPGFNATGDTLGTKDCNGHGTNVASILAGKNYGVAEETVVVPVRVLDCNGEGSVSSLLSGINWVIADKIAKKKPSVANLSLAGAASSALDAAIDQMIDAGIITVVAAGNNGDDACNYSPARVPRALTVGATTDSDSQASWSNSGACVDIFAPGLGITGASNTGNKATSTLSGTSQAAPFVAGVAAVWLEKYPTATATTISLDVLTHATPDIVTGLSNPATPNLLLCTLFTDLANSMPVTQVIADSGFDNGQAFWKVDVCTVVNQTGCPPDSAVDLMSMATLPSFSGNTHASLGGVTQDMHLISSLVTIPSTATSAELSFWQWVITQEADDTDQDKLRVDVLDATGHLLHTLGTFSNADACDTYQRRYFDLTPYRGKTIQISFTVTGDKDALLTWFLLDDVQLNAWQ
jgi:subtilisin family serine protease